MRTRCTCGYSDSRAGISVNASLPRTRYNSKLPRFSRFPKLPRSFKLPRFLQSTNTRKPGCPTSPACQRDWHYITEQPAPALHLARPRGVLPLRHVRAYDDGIRTGPPRARAQVIHSDLGYWAVSGSIQASHLRRYHHPSRPA